MKLENQVVSLELSKKLKELGFKQESLFAYNAGGAVLGCGKISPEPMLWGEDNSPFISAFTSSELGEMLPAGHISCSRTLSVSYPSAGETGWRVKYIKDSYDKYEKDNTMANAMALMLIHLKENNLI